MQNITILINLITHYSTDAYPLIKIKIILIFL